VLLLALLGLSALPASAALKIVASTPDLGVVARSVGAERVHVDVLALHTQDPHWVDAKPHLALALAKADLLVITGAELEVGWLPTLQTGSRNGAVQPGGKGFVDCSTFVDLIGVPGKVDRSMGDIHPSGNPHYMLDPRAVERVAVGIGKRLASLDPPGRDYYLERTKAFVGGLRSARQRWETELSRLRGTKVITYHRSLDYLARFAGFSIVEQVEPKPGTPPNPGHVAHVIEAARATRARLLVQETWFPTDTSQKIAGEAKLRLAVVGTMPNFARGESYVTFLDRVVSALSGSP
jgi:zinc/manganese transport system substrate-binding protein